MVYNRADQLSRWPGQHQYGYLQTGSLQYQYDDATPRVLQKTFSYTDTNLLSSVVHTGIGTSAMVWDADGNRVSFTSSQGTGTWQYVYDTTAGIPAVIGEIWPDTYWTGYIREPNGALIAAVSNPGVAPTYLYYHFDALGSTRLLTDGTGAVTDTYSYDAWGNVTAHTGTITQPYQYVGQLGYYSHYQDVNLPLLQLGVRFYDPALGRFTQVDPLRDTLSLYS